MILNFSSLLIKRVYLNLQKFFHNSSYYLASHYDTLKLKNTCTSKEIRDSFLKLSKVYHPDLNKNPNAHKEFLKIQEAYSVLSKPDQRATYDLGLSNPWNQGTYTYHSRPSYRYEQRSGPQYTTRGRNPWDDPSFYHYRHGSRNTYYDPNDSYYGVKGIKRQSNGTVAFFVVVSAFLMFILQMMMIRYAYSMQNARMNRTTMELQRMINESQEQAERNGNELQNEILAKRLEAEQLMRAQQKYK